MKQIHRALVEMKYSKWVDVVTPNGTRDEIEEEVKNMVDSGEIEMSEPDDYDGYSVATVERIHVDPETAAQVKSWARAVIGALAIADPKAVACMSQDNACEFLEALRENWVDVPFYADSNDLVEAAKLYHDLAVVRR